MKTEEEIRIALEKAKDEIQELNNKLRFADMSCAERTKVALEWVLE